MPEPLSISLVAGCVGGYAALHSATRGGSAISTEAQSVRRAATVLRVSSERSQALFGDKATAISQIWELKDACAEADWNGDEASPIAWMSAMSAQEFIRVLPDGIPLPEFAPEPDGSISLDWIESRHRLFSLSLGETSRIAYAWVDGTDRGHGVAQFDGEKIPQKILEGIAGIMNHEISAVRSL